MKINNIKSLEKHARTLNEQIKYCKQEPNTVEESNILEALETELNRISGYLTNLRLIKNSPPGVIINFLSGYIPQICPELAEVIKFEILDEKRIRIAIPAQFLGYNLAIDDQYEPVNKDHTDMWEEFHDNVGRRNHPYQPILKRLNELDQDFSAYKSDYSYDYDFLDFTFEFTKVHASVGVLPLLWSDVMREVIILCNLHRQSQGLNLL